jgi:hypothetical protein
MKLIFIIGTADTRSNFSSLLTTRLDVANIKHQSNETADAIHQAIHARRSAVAPAVFLVPQTGIQDFPTFQRHFPNDLIGVNVDEFATAAEALYFINTTVLGQIPA